MAQRYPHLLPIESEIWHRFITNPPVDFISLDYDVHLGKGTPIQPDWDEAIIRQVMATSRKRVDVVAQTATEIWIIEITRRGGMGALGKLLNYHRLYQAEYAPTKPIRKVLVCEYLEHDVEAQFDREGVTIYYV